MSILNPLNEFGINEVIIQLIMYVYDNSTNNIVSSNFTHIFFHTRVSSVKVIGSKNNIFNFNLILIYVVNYILLLYDVRSKSIVYKRFYNSFFSINELGRY